MEYRRYIHCRIIWMILLVVFLWSCCYGNVGSNNVMKVINDIRISVREKGGNSKDIESRFLALTNDFSDQYSHKRIYHELVKMYCGLDGNYSKVKLYDDCNDRAIFYIKRILELSCCDVRDRVKLYYILGETFFKRHSEINTDDLYQGTLSLVNGLYIIFTKLKNGSKQPIPNVFRYNIEGNGGQIERDIIEKHNEALTNREEVELQNFLLEYKTIYKGALYEIYPDTRSYDDRELKRIIEDIVERNIDITNYFKRP